MKNKRIVFRTSLILMMCLVFGYSEISYAVPPEGEPTLKEVLEKPEEKTVAKEAAKEEAQQTPAPEKTVKSIKPLGPVDKHDRGVPRTAVAGYFAAVKANDFEKAMEYLDLRNLPRGYSKSDGPELARHLKIILDRALWVDMDTLSIDPKGHKDDGLPSYRDLVGRITLKDDHVNITLQRVPRGDGVYIWKFSSATIRDIPRLYDTYGYGKWGEKLYLSLPDIKFLTLQLWQWVIFAVLITISFIVAFIPTYLVGLLLKRKGTDKSLLWARFITGPLRWLIVLGITVYWIDVIHPSVETRALIRARTITTIIVAWAFIAIINIIKEHWADKLRRRDREHAVVLLRPAATAVKVLIVIIAALVWLDNIGYQVTTLIAGLGIGGIAVALAAQKSIENLIGAATLYAATPVHVGDFCRFGDKVGTVEEIGLRSTRIRTLERTVITIPNADFAAMPIENFADREKIRFSPQLYLRYGTKPEQLKQIIIEVEKLLNEHEKVGDKPNVARFMGFGSYALELNVLAFVLTTDYLEYLEIAEELNMRILEIVDAAGAELANPAKELFKEKTT